MPSRRTIPFDYPAPGAAAAALPGAGLPWLDALRDEGRRLSADGLPSTRTEAWKYTSLAPLTELEFPPPALGAEVLSADLAAGAFDGLEGPSLVFVNGRLSGRHSRSDSLPSSLGVRGLAQGLADDPAGIEALVGGAESLNGDLLAAFNAAYAADGCIVETKPGVTVDQPVLLRFMAAPGSGPLAYHPRVIVRLGGGSSLTLVECHDGPAGTPTWSNPLVDIQIGERARLSHVKLQVEGESAYHTALTKVSLAGEARYESHLLALGARLARHEIHVRFDGEEADCQLRGGYMARGSQHMDNTTVIDHAVPHCESREVYKGVLDDTARGVFQGKIIVRQDAQKTDGHQLNRTLLLSRKAEIDTKPELEIYADDVKCSHGATAGEPEADQLFYLRSRGLDHRTALALIVEGFMGELLEEIGHEPVRAALTARVADWIEGGEGS
ncbi:MAG: Fe-S cluster assembly protein SufD [Rhodospirillales bacterium]|nr:Fe-S cluster assembly protein SufD [Rhodospirillales bacterium]